MPFCAATRRTGSSESSGKVALAFGLRKLSGIHSWYGAVYVDVCFHKPSIIIMRMLLTCVTGVGMDTSFRLEYYPTIMFHPACLAIYRAAVVDPAVSHITLLTDGLYAVGRSFPPDAPDRTAVIIPSNFLLIFSDSGSAWPRAMLASGH